MQEAWGHAPLLLVDLEYKANAENPVQLTPPPEVIKSTMLCCFDSMFHSLASVRNDLIGARNFEVRAPALTDNGWATEPRVVTARFVLPCRNHICQVAIDFANA
jgi:hypothetical protein